MSHPQIEFASYTALDADDFYEAVQESIAEVSPWLPWCHADFSVDDAWEWLEGRFEGAKERVEHAFSIRDSEGTFVGGCGLNQLHPMHGSANLGYWIRSSQARRGLATAAVAKLAEFAFTETDLVRLEIVCSVDNLGSQRVAEKAGAIREGVLRDKLWGSDGPSDAVMYALLRSEYRREGA
jgi:ribosomal-protein-serine acetyltransferase